MGRFVMAAAVIDNILYFSDRYCNGLYQLDLNNGECTFIDFFFEEKSGEWLYFQAYEWEGKIYFIPGLAENIACFDIKSKQITYIKLPQEGVVIHGVNGLYAEKFCCQKCGNILWMIPVGYNLFLKFDLSSEQLYKIDLPESIEFVEGIFNWRTSYLYENEIIFQPWAGNVQARYDIVTGIFKLEKFKEEIRTYRSCFKLENYEIYVPLEMKNRLLIRSLVNKREKKIPFNNCVKNCIYDVVFLVESKLYIIPQFGKIVIVFDLSDFNMKYIDLNKMFNKDYEFWRWGNFTESQYKYYTFSSYTSEILQVDKKSGQMKLIEVKREGYGSIKKRFNRCIGNLNKKSFQVNCEEILNEKK